MARNKPTRKRRPNKNNVYAIAREIKLDLTKILDENKAAIADMQRATETIKIAYNLLWLLSLYDNEYTVELLNEAEVTLDEVSTEDLQKMQFDLYCFMRLSNMRLKALINVRKQWVETALDYYKIVASRKIITQKYAVSGGVSKLKDLRDDIDSHIMDYMSVAGAFSNLIETQAKMMDVVDVVPNLRPVWEKVEKLFAKKTHENEDGYIGKVNDVVVKAIDERSEEFTTKLKEIAAQEDTEEDVVEDVAKNTSETTVDAKAEDATENAAEATVENESEDVVKNTVEDAVENTEEDKVEETADVVVSTETETTSTDCNADDVSTTEEQDGEQR